jgi:hypothetical protein
MPSSEAVRDATLEASIATLRLRLSVTLWNEMAAFTLAPTHRFVQTMTRQSR